MISFVLAVLDRSEAQDSFEYLLAVGGVVVLMVSALYVGFGFGDPTGIVGDVIGHICPSIDTAASPASTVGSCLGF